MPAVVTALEPAHVDGALGQVDVVPESRRNGSGPLMKSSGLDFAESTHKSERRPILVHWSALFPQFFLVVAGKVDKFVYKKQLVSGAPPRQLIPAGNFRLNYR
jgi:hypothetical protein